MLKLMMLALLSCTVLIGGDKKPSANADAVKRCMDGCAKSLENCKRNAKTPQAMTACTQSNSSCRAACNK